MTNPALQEELLNRDALNRLQRQKLAALLREVQQNTFYRERLGGLAYNASIDPLERLPLTTRAEIEQDQQSHPRYGTLLTYPLNRYARLHQTSGSNGAPLRWLDTPESWEWWKRCWAVVYRGAGLTSEDRLLFAFSFGPFIGFWSAFESAAGLGNLCLPAGGMTTTARLRYVLDNGVTVVCCTPTYALRMTEVAAAEKIDLAASPVRALIVAGEPGGSIPAVRRKIETAWGARVFDHCGMTEMGAYGFECVEAPGGMHIIESEFIAEVIDPQTLQPAVDGRGELVLTNLGRFGSPLIRYRTGDIVSLRHGQCACGRWFARLEGGILGRADDMLVIRGNNVFPAAIEGIVREVEGVAEFRIEAQQRGPLSDLCIDIEPVSAAVGNGLAQLVEDAIRDRLHFKPTVRLVAPGSLPRFEMKARRVVRSESDR